MKIGHANAQISYIGKSRANISTPLTFSLNFREHVTSKNLALEVISPDLEQCSVCGSSSHSEMGLEIPQRRKSSSTVQVSRLQPPMECEE